MMGALATTAAADEPANVEFLRDIRPLFEQHCYECHGPRKQESGLRLDRRKAALAGGDLGSDIVPGKSSESRLVAALLGASEAISQMPPEREPLAREKIAMIEQWIDAGAD